MTVPASRTGQAKQAVGRGMHARLLRCDVMREGAPVQRTKAHLGSRTWRRMRARSNPPARGKGEQRTDGHPGRWMDAVERAGLAGRSLAQASHAVGQTHPTRPSSTGRAINVRSPCQAQGGPATQNPRSRSRGVNKGGEKRGVESVVSLSGSSRTSVSGDSLPRVVSGLPSEGNPSPPPHSTLSHPQGWA